MTTAQLQQTEAQFQAAVIAYAKLAGWKVFHPLDSRGSEPGWPDLTLVRNGELVFAELKAEKGRVSLAQSGWLMALEDVADGSNIPVEVRVWRPSDWPAIERVLA